MTEECQENLYHKELDTILRFGALINSSLNIEHVLDKAMKWVEEFMEAEASSIYELDEESNELFVRLARGEKKEPLQGVRLKIGEGIAGFVAQSGKPKVIQNVREEERFSDKFDKYTGFKTRSMICVPLILRDKTVGVFQVLNKKSNNHFTHADLELLTGVGQQVAVAMENAKLYQRMEEKFELTADELKQAQEKLIRSERLAAMGNLVQGVAHEVRNPIMTIGGFAFRIKKEDEGETKIQKYADIILEESGRLEKLVKQVHTFSEVQKSELRPDYLVPVITKVLNFFDEQAGKQGIEFRVDMTDEDVKVNMDISQLDIAFSNIIENALEAMPEGGVISVNSARSKDNVLITINDNGPGILEDQLDSVYDPFVTSKTRGAGLGLTMVHQITMNHRGDIHVESLPGKGTTVTIKLPILYD